MPSPGDLPGPTSACDVPRHTMSRSALPTSLPVVALPGAPRHAKPASVLADRPVHGPCGPSRVTCPGCTCHADYPIRSTSSPTDEPCQPVGRQTNLCAPYPSDVPSCSRAGHRDGSSHPHPETRLALETPEPRMNRPRPVRAIRQSMPSHSITGRPTSHSAPSPVTIRYASIQSVTLRHALTARRELRPGDKVNLRLPVPPS